MPALWLVRSPVNQTPWNGSIAALLWMLALWSSLWSVFVETGSSWWICRLFVTFGCISFVLIGQSFLVFDGPYSLSVFNHYSVLLVLPCFAYAVIIIKTVVFKTQNNWAVKVTDASAKQALMIRCFWKSDKPPISPSTYRPTKHNFTDTANSSKRFKNKRFKKHMVHASDFFLLSMAKMPDKLIKKGTEQRKWAKIWVHHKKISAPQYLGATLFTCVLQEALFLPVSFSRIQYLILRPLRSPLL